MNIKKEILEIPGVLQQVLEEGRPQYDALVRRASWTERPVFMVGDASSYMAALTGAWAFESLLGVPVVVQRSAHFAAYTCSALAVRSLVIVVSSPDESQEALLAARKAKRNGAIVWALTANPDGELASISDAALSYYPAESPTNGILSAFCRHVAMVLLATAAGQIVKGPALNQNQQEDLENLPKHIEWVLNHIADAARALAPRIASRRVSVVGAGSFHPAALQAAYQLVKLASVNAHGYELLQFDQTSHHLLQQDEVILYLSSSRCGLKAQVHQSARELRQKGDLEILAITDSNDRQLSDRATFSVLLPILTEPAGALLALVFLNLVTHCATQPSVNGSRKRR